MHLINIKIKYFKSKTNTIKYQETLTWIQVYFQVWKMQQWKFKYNQVFQAQRGHPVLIFWLCSLFS